MRLLEDAEFTVGIQCLVFHNDCLLLGHRVNTFGHGSWGLPGGKLKRGETFLEAAHRELMEEVGLELTSARVVALVDPAESISYHLQVGVLVEKWTGIVSLCEPSKCDRWQFFSTAELPCPLFVSALPVIDKFRAGVFH